MRHLWLCLFLVLSALPPAAMRLGAEPLAFDLAEGRDRHRFFQDGEVQAHLVLEGGSPARLVMAFPAGNSGMAVTFAGMGTRPGEAGPGLTWSTPPRAVETPDGGRGLRFGVRVGGREVRLTQVLLESVRFLRDLPNPAAVADRLQARIAYLARVGLPPMGIMEPVGEVEEGPDGRLVRFQRIEPAGRHRYELSIALPAGATARQAAGGWVVTGPGPDLDLTCTARVEFPPLRPFQAGEILRPEVMDWLRQRTSESSPAAERLREAFRGLRFLCYREKFLAGSWRYLTYFGRDTLLTLLLLQDCLSPAVAAAGLQSVLDRLSADGQVAHEEDIGGQAIHRHLGGTGAGPGEGAGGTGGLGAGGEFGAGGEGGEARATFGREAAPVNDYKMIDDDFLLPIALERFLADPAVPAAARAEFLETPGPDGTSNLEAALRNMEWCLRRAIRFREGAGAGRLVGITHPTVGDWRDSDAGLGWGRYSGNVNLVLVPAALRSIGRLLADLPVPPKVRERLVSRTGTPCLHRLLSHPGWLAGLDGRWREAAGLFQVTADADEVRRAATAYLAQGPWSAAERAWFRAQPLEAGSVGEFLDGRAVSGDLRDGLAFPALSLRGDGSPVRVVNSDVGFILFLGEPDEGDLWEIVRLLRLPFPLGVRTPVGILAANPFLAEPRLWRDLGRGSYHGLVVWGWQQAMITRGLLRQIARWNGRAGGEDLVAAMRGVVADIAAGEAAIGRLANSELWSWRIAGGRMEAVAYGSESGTETQANPVQLWSTVHLGVARALEAAEFAP